VLELLEDAAHALEQVGVGRGLGDEVVGTPQQALDDVRGSVVKRMNGIRRVASDALTSVQKAYPSIPGMSTSEMIRSGARDRIRESASAPLRASSTR
jgi:hypothetical protein